MKKLICEKCGHDKWRQMNGRVLTCMPPIYIDIYECANCGNKYEESHRPHEGMFVAKEVFIKEGE